MLPSSFSVRKIGLSEMEEEPNFCDLVAEYSEMAIEGLPKPNWQPEIYKNLEKTGNFCFFGAFDDSGLIGFASLIHSISAHYGILIGNVETLFVGKEKRRGGVGLRLKKAVEDYAREVGCAFIFFSVPLNGSLDAVLEADEDCHTIYRIAVKVLA